MPAASEETRPTPDQGVIPDPKPKDPEAEIAADDAGASAMAERAGNAQSGKTA
ncbi:MAG: hypothetical protein ACK4Y4_12030 [Brevundimonas sp.]